MVVAVVTLLVAVPPVAAPATALGGSAFAQFSAEDLAVMMEQEPYMELDEQVRTVASAQASPPLAGTRIDRANRTLFVYWVGGAPAELARIQKSATQVGLTVKIVPAAFSEQALMAATNDLATVAESTGAELSMTIHNDGSGVTVHLDGLPEAAQGRAAPTQVQSRILDAVNAVGTRTGIPITLADGDPRQPVPQTRTDDQSPHWGGAKTATATNSCTSGFSMLATGSPSTRFMMTAGHCSRFTDGVAVGNGVGVNMGVTDFIHELFDTPPRYDLGVIRLNGTNQGRVYKEETTLNGLVVLGFANGIPAGGTYCISAVVSTPNCQLLAGNQKQLCNRPWIPFQRCFYYIDYTSTTGAEVSCGGDSGGPIYYKSGSGIIAAGVASFGWQTPCARDGGMSVVSTAMNRISGLMVVRSS